MFDFIHGVLMNLTLLFIQLLIVLYILSLLCRGFVKMLLFILKRTERNDKPE